MRTQGTARNDVCGLGPWRIASHQRAAGCRDGEALTPPSLLVVAIIGG